MRRQTENRKTKIVIAGAGPAGSSAAIRLAKSGFDVTLVERKHFPREKLCGEFISPECLTHIQQLDVLDEMLSAGGERIFETRFYETGGRSVAVPSSWFGGPGFALSLSRAAMDNILLAEARRSGVEVHEGFSVTAIKRDNGRLASLTAQDVGRRQLDLAADIFIDATGRARALAKLAARNSGQPRRKITKPGFVGFKAHLYERTISQGICEIYSFPGGYAGLSNVENGMANLCFLVRADSVRSTGQNGADIVRQIVVRNKRAADTLGGCDLAVKWLAVAVDGFGTDEPSPAANLFTIGDAASFIDPFTGSGMAMAFDSSQLLAEAIGQGAMGENYAAMYAEKFGRRLRICSVLRRTAFMPRVATGAVGLLSLSTRVRRALARSTRG